MPPRLRHILPILHHTPSHHPDALLLTLLHFIPQLPPATYGIAQLTHHLAPKYPWLTTTLLFAALALLISTRQLPYFFSLTHTTHTLHIAHPWPTIPIITTSPSSAATATPASSPTSSTAPPTTPLPSSYRLR